MATINLCGFESGDTIECYQATGTYSVQTGTARNSGYALRCNPTGFNSGYVIIRGVGADGESAEASVTDSYVRFYFRFAALPSLDMPIAKIEGPTAAMKLTIKLKSTGVLGTEDAMLWTASGAITLSANTWYRINVVCGSDGSTGEIKVSVDGTLDINTTGNTNGAAAAQITLGRTFGPSEDIDYFYDDFIWDDASAPGEGQIAALLIDGNGTDTAGSANGAGTRWECLDERPHDGDTTYVNGVTSGNSSTYTIDASTISVASGAIAKVVLVAKENVGAAGFDAYVRIRDSSGVTETASSGGALGDWIGMFLIMDETGGSDPWTDAELAQVEIGYQQGAGAATRVTAAYLMVDFEEAPPAPHVKWRRQRQTAARFPSPLVVW